MKKLIVFGIIFICFLACRSLSDGFRLVESFTEDVKNKEIGYNEIIQLYLCNFTKDKHQEKIDLTISQLTELRKILNSTKVQIQPYSEVPVGEQTVETDSDENIYRILANEQHVCFVLVRGHKIISFSTMKKGRQGGEVFITFCD